MTRKKSTQKAKADQKHSRTGAHSETARSEFIEMLVLLRGQKTQQQLGEDLGVTQTQISAWMRGRDKPSVEALMKLAKLAPSRESRLKFLELAGADLSVLRLDLLADSTPVRREPDSHLVVTFPVIQGFVSARDGKIVPQQNDRDALNISAGCFEHLGSTECIQVNRSSQLLGGLPWPLTTGDLVFVDRSKADVGDLVRPNHSTLAGVLIERVPGNMEIQLTEKDRERLGFDRGNRIRVDQFFDRRKAIRQQELQQKIHPVAAEFQRAFEDELWTSISTEMERPTILFGWLTVQWAGEGVMEVGFRSEPRGRLLLNLGSNRGIPLTEWIEGLNPLEVTGDLLFPGVRIFGSVVGWISTPAPISEAHGTPESENR